MKNPLWKCTLQRGFYKFNLFYFYSVLQVNRSVALTELRVQVIALLPFSEEMYLPLFPCKLIWLFPVLRTVNLSHPAKAERLQLIGAFPFSLESKSSKSNSTGTGIYNSKFLPSSNIITVTSHGSSAIFARNIAVVITL